jgi:ATP-dependent helicase HrpA
VPLPESATRLAELLGTPERFGHGSLTDALLKQVRDETSLDVKRADFKLDMLSPHLFMNFRVVDEHGRQLGHGRNLGALKAELGRQGARGLPGAGGAQAGGGGTQASDSDQKASSA